MRSGRFTCQRSRATAFSLVKTSPNRAARVPPPVTLTTGMSAPAVAKVRPSNTPIRVTAKSHIASCSGALRRSAITMR
jgi:hypothetical protein